MPSPCPASGSQREAATAPAPPRHWSLLAMTAPPEVAAQAMAIRGAPGPSTSPRCSGFSHWHSRAPLVPPDQPAHQAPTCFSACEGLSHDTTCFPHPPATSVSPLDCPWLPLPGTHCPWREPHHHSLTLTAVTSCLPHWPGTRDTAPSRPQPFPAVRPQTVRSQ